MFMKRTHWFMSISLLCFFTGSVWSQAVENSDLEKLSRRPVPKQPASTEKSSDTFRRVAPTDRRSNKRVGFINK